MKVQVLVEPSHPICSMCGWYLYPNPAIDMNARTRTVECRNSMCSRNEVALRLPLTVVECEVQAGGVA